MDAKVKQAISAALVEVRGVDNAMIPNIIEVIAGAKDEKEAAIALASSPRVRNLNRAIIPNVIAAVNAAGAALEAAAATAPAAETSEKVLTADERKQKILDAVTETMDVGDAEDLTSGGIPKVEVIEEMVGFDLKASERDEAVAAYNASKG